MATSISVSEETRNKLVTMKMDEGLSSLDELLKRMIVERKRAKLIEASSRFRRTMDKKGLSVKELVE